MEILTSNGFLIAAGSLIGLLTLAITFSVRHFRRLILVKSLLLRIPVALYDGMILEVPEAGHESASRRQAKRFACREVMRAEQYNQELEIIFSERYQHACVYPLRSRVSLAAATLSLLILTMLGLGLAGQSEPQEVPTGVPSSATSAPDSPATEPAAKQVESYDAHADAWRHVVLAALPVAGLIIGVALGLFAVCFVACYHYGVHEVLVDDVITLCEAVGLMALRADPTTGRSQISSLVAAADDPQFKALLRLVDKSA